MCKRSLDLKNINEGDVFVFTKVGTIWHTCNKSKYVDKNTMGVVVTRYAFSKDVTSKIAWCIASVEGTIVYLNLEYQSLLFV